MLALRAMSAPRGVDGEVALPASRPGRIAAFVALAYGLTWLAWSPLALRGLGAWSAHPPPWLHFVGALGPAVAAAVLAAREGPDVVRDLARRCVRAPARWLIVALVIPGAWFGVSALAVVVSGGALDLSGLGRSTEFPALSVAGNLAASILFYGFGEELGWRGYLLPRIAPGPSSARAVLGVAAIWAGWHLPLFAFSPGMAAMGLAGAAGWLASIVAASLMMSALYVASRSILVLALFHGTFDVVINSPVGDVSQVMGPLVTITGFTAPLWIPWLSRPRAAERRPRG